MTDRLKKILTVGGVIIVIFFIASFLSNRNEEKNLASTTVGTSFVPRTSNTRSTAVTLSKIESIEVKMDVFFGHVFRSLVDFEVEVFPEPAGRDNPFAPIG